MGGEISCSNSRRFHPHAVLHKDLMEPAASLACSGQSGCRQDFVQMLLLAVSFLAVGMCVAGLRPTRLRPRLAVKMGLAWEPPEVAE